MDETIKDKNAEPASQKAEDNLDAGLQETFPASDPVSATRRPEKDDAGSDEA